PAPLTVKANDATRAAGAVNPSFTATYTGFVNRDGPSTLGGILAFSTPATTASPAGTYPITPNGLTAANYTLTFANGTLTVTPASVNPPPPPPVGPPPPPAG